MELTETQQEERKKAADFGEQFGRALWKSLSQNASEETAAYEFRKFAEMIWDTDNSGSS